MCTGRGLRPRATRNNGMIWARLWRISARGGGGAACEGHNSMWEDPKFSRQVRCRKRPAFASRIRESTTEEGFRVPLRS